jgi:signal transduction histidine kinase
VDPVIQPDVALAMASLDTVVAPEWNQGLARLKENLEREQRLRRRAECTAHVHTDAVQLALDLLVREPDVSGFFRGFMKTLVDESDSCACGVWLLDDNDSQCRLWMAYCEDGFVDGDSSDLPVTPEARAALAAHFVSYKPGWTSTIEYAADDPRLSSSIRDFTRDMHVHSFTVAPLVLPTRNLGWIVLFTTAAENQPEHHAAGCGCGLCAWRTTLIEATARQATLALHHSRIAEQSRAEARRQAVLEERNRIARDIHDTLAQGFAAILMQLQAAQRSAAVLPPNVKKALDAAVDLARSHMVEARRSVGALRPHTSEGEDLGSALRRLTDLARRTSDMEIELTVDQLPPFINGVEREIVGIAQEAITNAVRHSRGRRIKVHASAVRSIGFRLQVADDGRGIPKEDRASGFGMTSMQERAERIGASLTIVTAPRLGTEVVVAWEPPSFSIPNGSAAHAGL